MTSFGWWQEQVAKAQLVMCCICYEGVTLDDVWVDSEGVRWDICKDCADREEMYKGKPCPRGPHRPPEGPNEDVGACPVCGAMSFELRPEGETYGEHLPDCSLPVRHESYCQPGGEGHPPSRVVRG